MILIKRRYYEPSKRVKPSNYTFRVTADDELRAYLSLPHFYLFDLSFKIRSVLYTGFTLLLIPILLAYNWHRAGELFPNDGLIVLFIFMILFLVPGLLIMKGDGRWDVVQFDKLCRQFEIKLLMSLVEASSSFSKESVCHRLGNRFDASAPPSFKEYKFYKNNTTACGSLKFSQLINNAIAFLEDKYDIISCICPNLNEIGIFVITWNSEFIHLARDKNEWIEFVKRKDVRIELSNLFFKCRPGVYEKPTKQKNICGFKLSEDGKIEEYTAYFQNGGKETIKVF